jgi:epoxyqueuosine reductase
LLGGIAVSIVLPYDQPMRPHCGTCTRCMEACPTGAIVRPGVIDARRCIAYHTIESRTEVPDYVARAMGNRVFGCDLCQEACPMNREPGRSSRPNLVPTSDPSRMPRPELFRLELSALSKMTDHGIRRVFWGTAVLRARPERLRAMAAAAVRNAPPAQ